MSKVSVTCLVFLAEWEVISVTLHLKPASTLTHSTLLCFVQTRRARTMSSDSGSEPEDMQPLDERSTVPLRDQSLEAAAVASDERAAYLDQVHALRRRIEEEQSLRMQEEEERYMLMEQVKHLRVGNQGERPLTGSSGQEERPHSKRHGAPGAREELSRGAHDEERDDDIPGSRERLMECVQQHLQQCNELEKELKRERASRWNALQMSMEADNSLEKTKKLEEAMKKQARLEAQIADMEHRAWVADLSQMQMQAMQKRRDVNALHLLLQREESRRRQLIREITSVQEMKERAMNYIGKRSNKFADTGEDKEDGDGDSD